MQPPSEPTAPPSSSFPGMPSPSPRKNLFTRQGVLKRMLPVALVVVLIAALGGAFYLARGVASPSRQASGPITTATTGDSATATDGATATDTPTDGTPAPGPTPPPTQASTGGGGNPPAKKADVRVTQNQNATQPCINDPSDPYTVKLFNAGTVSANWHVSFPNDIGDVPGGPPPLALPFSAPPFWGTATPQDGSIMPGQAASFVISVVMVIPCGTAYKASVQLSFPSGGTQADIPLSFAGTGPARHSEVVLVAGSKNTIQPCPGGGAAPAPFTFAVKNIGNSKASATVYTTQYVGSHDWANTTISRSPQGSDPALIYPGQTWTVTVSPLAGVSCDGTAYVTWMQINNAQGTVDYIGINDTFN